MLTNNRIGNRRIMSGFRFTLASRKIFLRFNLISSKFWKVSLEETINGCAEALYNSDFYSSQFSKETFGQLMYSATKSVEFSFDNTMYQQINGVAQSSPFDPALSNIFVKFYEHLLLKNFSKPLFYFRYVNDTSGIFSNKTECIQFLRKLNILHPSLVFTHEKEINNLPSFLNVLVEKFNQKFFTSVCRKSTFTGQYTRWAHLDQSRGRQILLAL